MDVMDLLLVISANLKEFSQQLSIQSRCVVKLYRYYFNFFLVRTAFLSDYKNIISIFSRSRTIIFVAFCFSLNKNVDSECGQKTVSF